MKPLLHQVMPLFGIDSSGWSDCCNTKLYEAERGSVNWHADSKQSFQGSKQPITILSMSLGGARLFEVRAKHNNKQLRSVVMEGQLLVTEAATQRQYQHRVPSATTRRRPG